MRNVRNSIVHGYDDIDMSIIWQIAIEDLPELKKCWKTCDMRMT